MKGKNMIKNFIVSMLTVFSISSAWAFDATRNPVTVIIPFGPGGGVDKTFRHFEKWANNKNINLTPVYKPGAEGVIGMTEIAGSPTNGYYLSFCTAGTIAAHRIKNPSVELELVTGIKNSIMVFVTHKDSGINSISDLQNSNDLTLGVGAPGQRIVMEQLLEVSNGKIKGRFISYKGGALVVQDLIGNHINLAAVPLEIVKSHVDAGTLKLLAVGSRNRVKEYSNVPSIVETYKDWKDNDWFAVVLPKGTDPTAIKVWNNILKEYLNDNSVQQDFAKDFNESTPFGKESLESVVLTSIKALSKK